MSAVRRQTFVDAPVDLVWELIADVNRHPEWWPRVLSVECEGLEAGCTYREVFKSPFGKEEFLVEAERLEDCKELLIRCRNTGTFCNFQLAPARDGTFIDAEFGMEPQGLASRAFDAVAGKRFFRNWLDQSLDAMSQVAAERARSSRAA